MEIISINKCTFYVQERLKKQKNRKSQTDTQYNGQAKKDTKTTIICKTLHRKLKI